MKTVSIELSSFLESSVHKKWPQTSDMFCIVLYKEHIGQMCIVWCMAVGMEV